MALFISFPLFFLLIACLSKFSEAVPASPSLSSAHYKLLKQTCISRNCAAVRLTVSNPPINLVDDNLITEFHTYLTALNATATPPKVVVISSADPDIWISHLDLHIPSKSSPPPPSVNATQSLVTYIEVIRLFGTLPVLFIGESNGLADGAGNEFSANLDMRFAGPAAVYGAFENAGGAFHTGGSQPMTRLVGPGLTSEYILSSAQVSAAEAERVGWVNAAFASEAALRSHVDTLAKRLANFNPKGLAAGKASIQESAPPVAALDRDVARFIALLAEPDVQKSIDLQLELSNNQTNRTWALNNPNNVATLIAPRIWGQWK